MGASSTSRLLVVGASGTAGVNQLPPQKLGCGTHQHWFVSLARATSPLIRIAPGSIETDMTAGLFRRSNKNCCRRSAGTLRYAGYCMLSAFLLPVQKRATLGQEIYVNGGAVALLPSRSVPAMSGWRGFQTSAPSSDSGANLPIRRRDSSGPARREPLYAVNHGLQTPRGIYERYRKHVSRKIYR
jgi:hypothetical protein